jgi:hypothetical protein
MPGTVPADRAVTVTTDEPIYSAAMSSLLQPLHLLLMLFAGWVNRHQLDVIDYLQEENRVRATRTVGSTFQVLLVLYLKMGVGLPRSAYRRRSQTAPVLLWPKRSWW